MPLEEQASRFQIATIRAEPTFRRWNFVGHE